MSPGAPGTPLGVRGGGGTAHAKLHVSIHFHIVFSAKPRARDPRNIAAEIVGLHGGNREGPRDACLGNRRNRRSFTCVAVRARRHERGQSRAGVEGQFVTIDQ